MIEMSFVGASNKHDNMNEFASNAFRISLMRPIKVILLAIGIVFCGGISCLHRNTPCPPVSLPSGIPKNQHVKIRFERFDKTKGIVWLRMTNWTAWPIRVPVEPFDANGMMSKEILKAARNHEDGSEALIRYYLNQYDPSPWGQIVYSDGRKDPPDEAAHPAVPKINRIDIVGEWWIPVKGSIIFQVPKQHLARNIALFVDMRYEWEALGVEALDGPVHRIFFRGIELPKDVQAEIK
jgi:hypothetical protein